MIEKEKRLTNVRFHFYKVKFTPYNHNRTDTTESIMRDVMTFLQKQQIAGKGFLIDRHESREKQNERFLFVTGSSFDLKQKRIKCSMALLRTGKTPFLKPAEKYTLVPLDTSNGQIAEQTHFFVDYSTSQVALCVEYNHDGPRMSDIEYYFRIVARDQLNKAKATEIEMVMDTSIDKALSELKNVLNFDIKVEPQKLAGLDTAIVGEYLTGITNLANKVRPNFIKLEATFQSPNKDVQSVELNKPANNMVRRILSAFKTKKQNIDVFDSFVVRYSDEYGNEEVFNLFKGKKEISKDIDLDMVKGPRQWHDLIDKDFTDFINKLNGQ